MTTGPWVRITGLWAHSPVEVDVVVRPRRVRGPLTVDLNERRHRVALKRRGRQVVEVLGTTDGDGALRMRLVPVKKGLGRPHVEELVVRQSGPPSVPWRRLLWYLGVLSLAAALGRLARSGPVGPYSTLALATVVLCVGLLAARLQTVLFLEWAVALEAAAVGMAAVAARSGLPAPHATVVCLVFLLRSVASLQPQFPGIDVAFHSEQIARFEAGEVITSRAPSPRPGEEALGVPYPPAFHALMSWLIRAGWSGGHTGVRLAMALLEGTAPLLLFGLMRAGGAPSAAAGWGASILASLPEGALVLAKGIAANVTGQWLSLLALLGVVKGWHGLVVSGLFAAAFLGHLGHAGCLVLLVGLWTARARWLGGRPAGRRVEMLALAGLGVAWLVYYREAMGLAASATATLGSQASADVGEFFRVRWIRAGKAAQDLVLKFGLLPAGVALVQVWARRRSAAPLDQLLLAWLAAAGAIGALALVSPIPLRFEYFALPAVAAAAALGAERLSPLGRACLVAVPLAVQAGLVAFLLTRRFYLISVILESERWPFPFRL